MAVRNESKKLWNWTRFPMKHFMLTFGNLPFELFLSSKEFSRKLFTLEFTLEFVELLLERSSEILISSSLESIWKIICWIFSLILLDLSISFQIFCFFLRLSNTSSSSLCKSDIFSSRVLFRDSNLWNLPSSNKLLTELIIVVTKARWRTLWLMEFWLVITLLLQIRMEWNENEVLAINIVRMT